MSNPEELQGFSLDDILNEFLQEEPEAGEEPAEVMYEEEVMTDEGAVTGKTAAEPETAAEKGSASEAKPDAPTAEPKAPLETPTKPAAETVRLEKLSDVVAANQEQAKKAAEVAAEAAPKAQPAPTVIEIDPKARLRDLKKKLIAGPEKRYYELAEMGIGKLQLSVFLNLIIVVLCAATTAMFTMGLVPDNRLRLVIFSQVLAMLVSALLGSNQLLDGLTDLLKFRFTVNTLMAITFGVCCVDAVFCLQEQRIPCCAAFSLEMALALLARYHRRSMEMAQMDTLRKAVRLYGMVRTPDFFESKPGILRNYGQVEHFTENYQGTTGPERFQNWFSFVSTLLCCGVAAYAGMNYGVSVAFQILSTSLLVAVPAGYFVALTRPAAILQTRLHMVGTVLCGWKGVKALKGKLVFPLKDEDLFPNSSTKLNGVKFYGDRNPDQVVSYTASLICAAGGGLEDVFRQLLTSRGCRELPISNFRSYGNGGMGGEINGESILMGNSGFLRDMGVDIPEGSMVNQAIYAAIDGELCAVVAISYAKMRSSSGGIVCLTGNRKLTSVMVGTDFMITESLIRNRFGVKTKRIIFPDHQKRAELAACQPDSSVPAAALTTRDDLISYAYAINGAKSLRTACILGTVIHVFGGLLGILIMAALAYLGSTQLLTPTNVLLYQLVWLIPGFLITEWTRAI